MRDIDRYCRDDRSDSETQTVHLKPMAMERDMERSKFSFRFSLYFACDICRFFWEYTFSIFSVKYKMCSLYVDD